MLSSLVVLINVTLMGLKFHRQSTQIGKRQPCERKLTAERSLQYSLVVYMGKLTNHLLL